MVDSLANIVIHTKCYIKGYERNTEKKAQDVKEHTANNYNNSQHLRRNQYISPVRDIETFKQNEKP